jgi:DNA-nicking Smr family endonuclease
MAKKKKKPSREEDSAAVPKFGGFKPFAGGLDAFKKQLAPEENKPPAAAAPAPAKPAPPAAASPKRSAAEEKEDELTFHRMMSGVTPLDAKSTRVPVTTDVKETRARIAPAELRKKAEAEAEEVLEHLHRLVDDAARFEVSDDGRRVEGRRVDLPPSLLRDLRHGKIPVDARLDLHGLRPGDARERVLEFLKDKRARGERCVLVIHGKGEGVLRGEIAAWLSQGRAREHVAAFATARDEDGGEGAVYVALRR